MLRYITALTFAGFQSMSFGQIANPGTGWSTQRRTAPMGAVAPRILKLMKDEARAEAGGDFKRAESICNKMVAAGEPARSVDRIRYMLYEKEGRPRKAYVAMKSAMTNSPQSFSSDTLDPVMLTHFGGLAEKAGKRSEAEIAYRRSLKSSLYYIKPEFYPSITENSSFSEIKSAALFVAGLKLSFQMRSTEAEEILRSAVQLDPQNWKTHFGLAFVLGPGASKGPTPKSLAETKKALRLVTAEEEGPLRRQLKALRMPDGDNRINIATTDSKGRLQIRLGKVKGK